MIDKLCMAGPGQRLGGCRALARLSAFMLLSLFLLPASQLAAQEHTVTGRVTSAELEPLIGVNVVVEGTTVGTITNAAGVYTLAAPSATGNLAFSALGYQDQTVPIDGRATINVSLQESAIALEGIVVVGYGQQTRATVSGAVSSVSSDDLEGTASTATSSALVGQIQGINTRMTTSGGGRNSGTGDPQDGRPGAATVLQIRNMGEPLFVIDGVPYDDSREFNMINPADIENISILKDASASIYGFRAANGVVLVTTKKGSESGAPQVRFDGYYGAQNLTRFHFSEMTTGYEFLWSEQDSRQNRGQSPSITPEELEKWRVGATPRYQTTDHYQLVVNNANAPQYNFNGSVTGGTPAAQYYVSMGHLKQEYVMKDNAFSRTNAQVNVSSQLTSGLRIGTEIRARQELHDNIAVPGNQDIVRSILLGVNSSWPQENPWVDRDTREMIDFNVTRVDRTVAMYDQDIAGWQTDLRRRGTGNFWAEYEFPFGTSLRGTYSHTFGLRSFDKHQYSFNAWDCQNRDDPSTCVEVDSGSPKFRQQVKREDVETFAQIQANHAQTFGAHSLSGTAAVELNGTERNETEIEAVPPNNLSHLIRITDVTGMDNDWGITRRASVAGRLNYDYAQKYLLEFLGRYDGSYLYAPENRWGFFPGVTAGWRVTQEPFLRDRFGFLNELKLRASLGETGREQGIQPWGYLGGGTYGAGNGSVLGANSLVPGVRPRGLPVTELSWVTSRMKNVGVDFVLFDNKFSGEFDVFERELSGLPAARYDVLIPIEVGYELPNENLESEATRGFEAILRYNDRIGGVNFSLAPNITVARTKVTKEYKPRFGNSLDEYFNAEEGRWENPQFGYEMIGQFTSVEEIENYPVNLDGRGNTSYLPGDYIYKDQNGDGLINGLDRRVIAFPENITPLVNFGVNTTISYQGLSLRTRLAGASGYSHDRGAETKNMFQGTHNAQRYFMDRYRRSDPFDPQSEWIPGTYPPFRQGGFNPSTRRDDTFWNTNVRFLRLREVELGYSVPANISSSVGLSSVRVYTSATNPWTVSTVDHYQIDPEVLQGTALVYPTISVVNVGFSATLGGGSTPVPVVPVPAAD